MQLSRNGLRTYRHFILSNKRPAAGVLSPNLIMPSNPDFVSFAGLGIEYPDLQRRKSTLQLDALLLGPFPGFKFGLEPPIDFEKKSGFRRVFAMVSHFTFHTGQRFSSLQRVPVLAQARNIQLVIARERSLVFGPLARRLTEVNKFSF